MRKAAAEVMEVLSFVGDIYQKPVNANATKITNLKKALFTAARNRVLYYFISAALDTDAIAENQELARLRATGKREIAKFYRTLEFLNSTLGRDSYLMLKTYKTYPYVTWDVDILVEDVEAVASMMAGRGFEIQRREPAKPSCHRDGLLSIGLHPRASWHHGRLMDDRLQWKSPRTVRYEGIEVFIPNCEVDFLTFIAHTNFENYHLTLGDLLYIYRLAGGVNWDIIQEQVTRHGWEKSFVRTIAIANGLHWALYNRSSPIEQVVPSVIEVKPRMPLLYPHRYIVAFHRELGITPRALAWELFFYTYRLWRIRGVKKLTYLDSFLYAPLGEENSEQD